MVFRTGSPQPGRQSNGTRFGKSVGRGCAEYTHVHIFGWRRASFSRRRVCPWTRCQVRAELPACCRLAVRSGRRPTGAALRSGWPPVGENGAGPESGQTLPGAMQSRGALPCSPQICGRPSVGVGKAILSGLRRRIQHLADQFHEGGKSGFPAGSRQGCALVRSSHACHGAGVARVEGGRAGWCRSLACVYMCTAFGGSGTEMRTANERQDRQAQTAGIRHSGYGA